MSEQSTDAQTSATNSNAVVTVAAYLSLLAGAALGLLALAGPIATWIGMADFRMGFGLLQIVNAWSDWVAGITLLVAIGIFVYARNKQLGKGGFLAGIALVGSVIGGLGYIVPETFRPPEGTPAIHDIATNPDAPLQYITIAPLRADAANNMEYGVMPGMEPEEHKRLQREAYPDIVPQEFSDSVSEVFDRALAAAQSMGWEIVSADAQIGRIEATDTTFWFRFKDDVVIEVTPTANGNGSVLNARSLSRVGRSDVGKNAERLREFFELL